MRNAKELGQTYGDVTLGLKNLVSTDSEMLRAVLVKEFACFENRPVSMCSNASLDKKSLIRNMLTVKRGDDWFSPEEKARRDPLTYMPFGYGPRNCVGVRLAEFEMRITLAVLLRKYRFLPGRTSPDLPLELESTRMLSSKQTLYVLAEHR